MSTEKHKPGAWVFVAAFLLHSCLVVAETDVATSDQSTAESVQRGSQLYRTYCITCHGENGKSRSATMADVTDLTAPERWRNGTGKADVLRSIKDGAGMDMPPYGFMLNDEELVDLANFTMSLWPAGK